MRKNHAPPEDNRQPFALLKYPESQAKDKHSFSQKRSAALMSIHGTNRFLPCSSGVHENGEKLPPGKVHRYPSAGTAAVPQEALHTRVRLRHEKNRPVLWHEHRHRFSRKLKPQPVDPADVTTPSPPSAEWCCLYLQGAAIRYILFRHKTVSVYNFSCRVLPSLIILYTVLRTVHKEKKIRDRLFLNL